MASLKIRKRLNQRKNKYKKVTLLQNHKYFIVYKDRFTEIERENRILYEKMANIYSKLKPLDYRTGKFIRTLSIIYIDHID